MNTNEELIAKYITYLQIERYYSIHTVTNYNRDLEYFSYFINKEFAKLTEAEIYQYITYLQKNYAENTVLRKYSSIKNCLKYLYSENLISVYPCNNIKVKKKTQKLPEYLDSNLINQLINSVDVINHFTARDRVILEILYSTGIRVSELIEIMLADVDLNEQFIKVKGKGKKERYVPFDRQTKKYIVLY